MIPLWAVDEALFSALNGKEVVSSRIIWGDVSSGTVAISGSALCVEWSSVRKPNDDLGIID